MDLASFNDHSTQPPQQREADGSPTWITRGAHFVVAITQVSAGTRLHVQGVGEEHLILLPDTGAEVVCTGARRLVAGDSLLIVPPGDCQVIAQAAGWVMRCFSLPFEALAELASNRAEYARPRAAVAPLVAWPAPVGGYRLRHYDLGAYLQGEQKTRVFRCRQLMINVLRPRTAPRDIHALSPHAHADFEQASISLQGIHQHHLRYPWGPDMSQWRDDQHLPLGSPSVMVIPPGVIHTTHNLNQGNALLVDLFAPPRLDFSLKPGVVCNADEYPLPPQP